MSAELNAIAAAHAQAEDAVADAIRDWAAPDEDLGWAGAPEVAHHADELAAHLLNTGVL